MRLLASLLAALLLVTGCNREAVQLQFDIPDGYAGILKIRSHRPDGIELRATNGVIEIHFATNGICDIRGKLPTLQWHRIGARYTTRGPVTWIQFSEQSPKDAVGLRALGLKDNVEAWYIIGTLKDVGAAVDQMYGFHVPQK
jgi:hypothetical protein